ncbi:S-layer protein [Desulforamulus profundi]|uniref:S-layer protein n=1 Tax=Desulforamulus profundi TaxID=1383067 RepID=A0A2C6L1Y0_9FIRM|nr:S-layer homology domain-containing protein [Desulforamulus profundi]PHJ37541.1 S-layer protein [Desulforamulus profundi]
MLRKKLCLFVTLVLSLLTITSAWAASSHLFRDTAGKWWEQSVAECSAAELVGGRGNGLFDPKAPVTRVEAIIFLNRALGQRAEADNYSMSQGGYNFSADFPAWGKKNVAFAADKGYISKAGIPNMQPRHPASRAEIAVLFANALKLSADGYQLNFKDKASIPASLQPFVAAAVKHGIMAGRPDNTFDPNANVTRGEMAAIIARMVENGKINPNPNKYFIAKLSAVDAVGKKITVVKGGQTVTLSLQTDALLYRTGKRGLLTTFKVNENVKVILDTTGKVAYIAYTAASPLSGSVSITTDSPSGNERRGYVVNMYLDYLTVRYDDGTSERLEKSTVSAGFYGLSRGQRVAITKVGGIVTGITPLNEARKVFGYIVNAGSSGITFEDLDGYERTLAYASGYRVKDQDGDSIDREDLEDGDSVEIELDSQEKAVTIKLLSDTVSSSSDLEGEVTYVKRSGSYRITIKKTDGSEKTYDVDQDVQVYKASGSSRNFDYINEHDYVKLKLNSRDVVVRIDILDIEVVEGEVRSIDTYDYVITVKNSSGREVEYDLDKDVKVWQDSKSRTLRNVTRGDKIRLLINDDNEVTVVNILGGSSSSGTYTGVIYALDIDEDKITFEKNSQRTVYNLDRDVTVRNDGSTLDLEDIIIGSEAEIRVENSKVTRIEITNDRDITIKGKLDRVSGVRIYIKQENGTSSGARHYFITETNVTIKDPNGRTISLSRLAENYIGEDVTIELDDGEIETLRVED